MGERKPKIRFKGFNDAWEQRKLNELVRFSKGSGYSKSDLRETGTPIILYGRLYTQYETEIHNVDSFVEANPNSVYSLGNEVIVPASGETAEDISVASVVTRKGIILGGDLNIITPPEYLDPSFLAISISNGKPHDDMAKMAQGKSVVHLHNSDLKTIDLPYPDYKEQASISSFFRGLDSIITLHQRKYEKLKTIKKSCLEKMFPKDGSRYPEVRFKGFTDAWEQRELKDISNKVTEKNTQNLYKETFTNSAEYGIISQRDFFDHDVSNEENVDGYYVVRDGDFVYNPRISTSAPCGPINCNSLGRNGIMSPLYTVFRTNGVNKTYLSWFFKTSSWHAYMHFNGDSGARSDRFAIKDDLFFQMPIPIPTEKEQAQIGAFLNDLDNLITLHQRKLEKLKNIKKSMLEKMFV